MKIKVNGIILSLVLMFAIILGFIPGVDTAMTIHAASTYCSSCSNFVFELQGTTLTISRAGGASSRDMCDKCNQNYSSWKSYIENVIIEDGITRIGDNAFAYCENLTSVTIPNTVTSIGSKSFYECNSLTSITLPNSIESIEHSAFEECENLTSIVIPEDVTSIEKYVFYNCSSLSSITIPEGVTNIGNSAFYGCSGLTSIDIPETVTDIGNSAFYGCSGLTSITIPEGVTAIGDNVFEGCSNMTSVTVSNTVTSIGDSAFKACSSLTGITLPAGVTAIGDNAFYGCSSLTSITIPGGVTAIGENVFCDCSSLSSITIPEGVKSIGKGAFSNCDSLTGIILPESLTGIGYYAFYGCADLTSITIPVGVTSIDSGVFYGCTGLTSIVIPEGITSIGDYAFYNCSNLAGIVIPHGVTSIGQEAFRYCDALTGITIPDSVTSIGSMAFRECISLNNVIIPENVTSIDSMAFYGCSSLTSFTVPCTLKEQMSDSDIKITWKHLSSTCTADDGADTMSLNCASCKSTYAVTLEAPAQTEYTGKAIEVTCTGITEYFSPTITYSGERLVDGKPVYPGTYTATLTYGEQEVSLEYTITATAGVCECGNIAWKMEGYNLIIFKAPGASSGAMCEKCNWVQGSTYVNQGFGNISVEEGVTSSGVCKECENIAYTIEGNTLTISKAGGAKSGDMCGSCYHNWELFYNSIETVDIKDGVTTIGTNAFMGMSFINKISIPKSVTSIENGAFLWCVGFENLTIPSTIKHIGDGAFANCAELSEITILGSDTELGNSLFGGYSSLNTINLNCGLKSQVENNSVLEGMQSEPTVNYLHLPVKVVANDTTDTITATCACSLKTYKVTLKAPSKTTYTGKAIVATCTNNIPDFTPVITYTGSNLVNGKPVKAGTYTATLTYGDKKVSLKYTITEAAAPAKPNKITNVVSGVHVYWPAVSGASKYGLWRSETGINGTYMWIANPTVAHFTDTKVTSGKTYYYKVTTLDTVNNVHSAKSAAIGITYVATPDITSRVNQAAGVKLGWNKIAGATGYAIYRKPYSGNSAWVRVGTIDSPNVLTWTDESVKTANGSMYKYTIRALAGSNSKTLSGCRGAGRTMVRLSSRTLSSATKATATSIKCSWNTTSQATGYEVRFMVGSTVYKTFTVGNYKTGVKTFTGLKAGQTYKIQVRTYKKVDGVGTFYSAWSTAKTVSL